MRQVDRRIAAVAHLSIGFGIVIGVGFLLGLAINLVIWLRSWRSPYVEYHAEQSGAYQLVVLLMNIGIVALGIGALVLVLGDPSTWSLQLSAWQAPMGVWCALLPLFLVWYFGTILYGVYGGLLVAAGREFSYPIFGPWAQRRLAAKGKALDG